VKVQFVITMAQSTVHNCEVLRCAKNDTFSRYIVSLLCGMLEVQKRLIIFYSVPIVLVGNKTDLHMERMISSEEGKRLADSWKAAFLETSAKQNEVWLCNFSLLSDYSLSISCTRVRTEGSDHNDCHFLGCGVL